MFERISKNKVMWLTIECLLIATLIWVCSQIGFVFSPLGTFISTLFAPILIAGFLFYLFDPVVRLLMKIKVREKNLSRTWSIAIVFLILAVLTAIAAAIIIPLLVSQIGALIVQTPDYLKTLQHLGNHYYRRLDQLTWFKQLKVDQYLTELQTNFLNWLKKLAGNLTMSLGSFINTITSITITIVTVPFILFYMLKDGEHFVPNVQKVFPSKHEDQVAELFHKMSQTLSKYIAGQVIECLFVATFISLGYWIIGMPYAFLLGVFAGMTNIIPYLGPYIGIFPALILGATLSTKMAILVIVVCIVVQQIDGNLIYPNVIGKTLKIHPLTIILLLLVAGNLAGLLGMILAVPVYAVLKVVIGYIYDIYRLHYEKDD
ncbi:AI-2E family transporter [Liquorilactobacillus sicerae]|uniref:AI-2E family transporter n=1 Tax=Liquorilactobacillus sicerae TaxID=1416943 RepID=UPI002481874B|nr:AI-2E family transporter [Liquorilactobacillus sicerae]